MSFGFSISCVLEVHNSRYNVSKALQAFMNTLHKAHSVVLKPVPYFQFFIIAAFDFHKPKLLCNKSDQNLVFKTTNISYLTVSINPGTAFGGLDSNSFNHTARTAVTSRSGENLLPNSFTWLLAGVSC